MSTTLIEPRSEPECEASAEYRRIARRVRCRLEKDPIGKQRALAALAKHIDGLRPTVAAAPDSGVRAFAESVSTALEGPILRYSRRQELIQQAEGLGIRRFDANLLIAAVQHRLGKTKTEVVVAATDKHFHWRRAFPIGLAILFQAVIILGAWGILHS